MRIRNIVLAALAASTAAVPALAQEGAPFTGPRIEGVIGVDRVQNNGHQDDVMFGVNAGYDFQAGNTVFGGEVEYTDSNNRSCNGGVATVEDPRLCLKAGRDLYAGARVGKVIGGSTLLYAKAGYTNADAKFTSDDGDDEVTIAKDHLDGVRVGAGIEHQFGMNTYVKAEYRYSNYEQGVERHQALAGVGFRF